jgi:hypothetical protein
MPIDNFPEENVREILTYLPMLHTMNLVSAIPPTKQVPDLLIAFDRLEFVKKGFDYDAWLKSLPEGFATDLNALASADFETVRNLITAHLRIDRFVGGHLDALLAKGYFHNVLLRINELQTL